MRDYDFNGQLLVGLLRGPSTGKSTLADAIAEENNGQVVEEPNGTGKKIIPIDS